MTKNQKETDKNARDMIVDLNALHELWDKTRQTGKTYHAVKQAKDIGALLIEHNDSMARTTEKREFFDDKQFMDKIEGAVLPGKFVRSWHIAKMLRNARDIKHVVFDPDVLYMMLMECGNVITSLMESKRKRKELIRDIHAVERQTEDAPNMIKSLILMLVLKEKGYDMEEIQEALCEICGACDDESDGKCVAKDKE